MPLTAVLQTRLSPAILEAFRARAKDLGFDSAAQMSRAWVIETVTQAPAPAGAQYDAIRITTYELHKLGVNLNQIARSLNAGRMQQASTIAARVDECTRMVESVNAAYRDLLANAQTPRIPK